MKFLFAILCISAAALAGCGGAGGLTKARYDAKLNHMCLRTADQVRELHMDNSIGDWKAFGPDLTAIDRRFTSKLAPKDAPASIRSAALAYGKANEKVVQIDDALVAAAKAGDRAKFRTLVKRVNAVNLATYPSAKAVGAKDCYFP